MDVKPVVFSQHALDQMGDRGTTLEEVEATIREGENAPASKGRKAFRKNFPFNAIWKNKHYDVKQVMPIVVDETSRFVIVTVYVFYFGGEQ